MKRIKEMKKPQSANQQVAETGAIDREHIMRPHASNYDYQLFTDKSICYLQFNKCSNAHDYPFASFLNDMFAKMDEVGIKTLVVDVQYNGGGDSQLCDELLLHLFPLNKRKFFTSYVRFSGLMAMYNPRIAVAKKSWEDDGHVDELYQMPAPKIPADYQQPKLFEGQVVFVMSKKTYSSAGILLTDARDNHVGTIIGTTSTFSPSHYGEILPYRLPNTDVLGSISCKFFARPDAATVDDTCMQPDIEVNLDDKDAAWQFIVEKYGNRGRQ
jgi:C-terminal processing protease CtpA/Prc